MRVGDGAGAGRALHSLAGVTDADDRVCLRCAVVEFLMHDKNYNGSIDLDECVTLLYARFGKVRHVPPPAPCSSLYAPHHLTLASHLPSLASLLPPTPRLPPPASHLPALPPPASHLPPPSSYFSPSSSRLSPLASRLPP